MFISIGPVASDYSVFHIRNQPLLHCHKLVNNAKSSYSPYFDHSNKRNDSHFKTDCKCVQGWSPKQQGKELKDLHTKWHNSFRQSPYGPLEPLKLKMKAQMLSQYIGDHNSTKSLRTVRMWQQDSWLVLLKRGSVWQLHLVHHPVFVEAKWSYFICHSKKKNLLSAGQSNRLKYFSL